MSSINNNNSFEKYISSTDTPHYKLEEYIINNNGNKPLSYIFNDNDKKPCRKSELHHSAFGGKRKSRRNLRKNINKTRKNIGGRPGGLALIEDFNEIYNNKNEQNYLVENPSKQDYIDAFGKERGEELYEDDKKYKIQSYYFTRRPLPDEFKYKMECNNDDINNTGIRYDTNMDYITVYNRVLCKAPGTIECEGDPKTKMELTGLNDEYNPFSTYSRKNGVNPVRMKCYNDKMELRKEELRKEERLRKEELRKEDLKERIAERLRKRLANDHSLSSKISPTRISPITSKISPTRISPITSKISPKRISPNTVTYQDVDTFFNTIEHGGCSSCAARVLLTSKKNRKKKSNKKTKKKGGSKCKKGKKTKKTNSYK
jgi:hypothetical protein